MIQIEKSDSEIKAVAYIISKVVADAVSSAVKHSARGVLAIAWGYTDEAGELFYSNFESNSEPYTAEQIAEKLTTRLSLEVEHAAEDGRTFREFVAILKLRDASTDEAIQRIGKGLPTVVPSMHGSAEDQATAKALDNIGKGLPTVVPNL